MLLKKIHTQRTGQADLASKESLQMRLLEEDKEEEGVVDKNVSNDDDANINHYDNYDRDKNNSNSSSSNDEKEYKASLCRRFRFVRALEMLLLFSYQTLTDQALQLVNCMSAGGCGTVLAEYPNIDCYSTKGYKPLKAVAIVLLLFAGLFPLLLLYKLFEIYNGKRKIKKGGNDDNGNNDKDEAVIDAKYGVFYDQYRPRFFWWEVLVS